MVPIGTQLFCYSKKQSRVLTISVCDVDRERFYFYVNNVGWKAKHSFIGKLFFFSKSELYATLGIEPPPLPNELFAKPVPDAAESCATCFSRKNGECWAPGRVCEDYRYCGSIPFSERDAWPEYGDALKFRFGYR